MTEDVPAVLGEFIPKNNTLFEASRRVALPSAELERAPGQGHRHGSALEAFALAVDISSITVDPYL